VWYGTGGPQRETRNSDPEHSPVLIGTIRLWHVGPLSLRRLPSPLLDDFLSADPLLLFVVFGLGVGAAVTERGKRAVLR